MEIVDIDDANTIFGNLRQVYNILVDIEGYVLEPWKENRKAPKSINTKYLEGLMNGEYFAPKKNEWKTAKLL